jgi:hypothetical protein
VLFYYQNSKRRHKTMPFPSANFQITNQVGFSIANGVFINGTAGVGTAGTLTSAASPATTLSGITGPNFNIQLDGDPTPRNIVLTNTDATGAAIAGEIQSVMQALTGVPASYKTATCAYTSSKYVITSALLGSTSQVVVTPGATATGSTTDIAATLKLTTVTGAVAVQGTDTGIFQTAAGAQNPYVAQENTRSRLWVTSDTAGYLYLIKDGIARLLNGGTTMTVQVPVIVTDLPIMFGSTYNIAHAAAGAKLKVEWLGGM